MVNIQDLFDDAKCYQTIRAMRWPDGVTCQRGSSGSVITNGRGETQPDRQRYECKGCHQRFDDLTDTIFAGHHQPLRTWIGCLYLMGLNLSGLQIAQELDISKDDARAMIAQLRQGIVDRRRPVVLRGEVDRESLLPDAWIAAHPEHFLTFRRDEAEAAAIARRRRRERRRAKAPEHSRSH
jgi:transposase-like protein